MTTFDFKKIKIWTSSIMHLKGVCDYEIDNQTSKPQPNPTQPPPTKTIHLSFTFLASNYRFSLLKKYVML